MKKKKKQNKKKKFKICQYMHIFQYDIKKMNWNAMERKSERNYTILCNTYVYRYR